MRGRLIWVTVVVALATAACQSSAGGIVVSEARIGVPSGPNGALYFTVVGGDQPDGLLAVSTHVAGSVEIHETAVGDDGTVGMRAIDSLRLPANGTLVLEPGGTHAMLIGVEELEEGETVDVILTWDRAGEMTVEALVVATLETTGHDHG